MDTYCQRANLNATNVRFLFEGQRITETQTPKDVINKLFSSIWKIMMKQMFLLNNLEADYKYI